MSKIKKFVAENVNEIVVITSYVLVLLVGYILGAAKDDEYDE